MASNVIDVMASLTLIMNEETDRLRGHERALDLAELATAKVRLVGVLETELARVNREQPGWTEALDDEERDALASALIALGDASTANAAILERQIDLSAEMMGAVAAEAKRLSGSRTSTYGARGDLSHMDLATPISVNSEY
ncbi:flagellar biosynthesis protein FlgN [Sphingomonas cavernae]|uniref:Flagellar biosynthesis protein FlgN n=1 Tax=Sphingomonas cavernae TaxID=2320861 RepID=A0A418W6X3_9SPHN|nr:flagellar biosynthesis protein FlgN [Sphingomonas cavernae]RJF85707.1 flagellar biosynthesis protein FlgN [Sphingomonas cavernae]